jgi:hypothetical protein
MGLNMFRRTPQPPRCDQVFAIANHWSAKTRIDLLRRLFFLKFLSEMGQQNGNVALMFAARHDIFFAMRKIACLAKRLGRVAGLLRCVHLDAVMHNRNADDAPQIGIDSGIEPVHDGSPLSLAGPSDFEQ